MQQMMQAICWAFVLHWGLVFLKYCLIFRAETVILQQMQQIQQIILIKTTGDAIERKSMNKLSFNDALKILENVDAQRADVYRTVVSAVQRLPMVYHTGLGNLWEHTKDAYIKAAIEDATEILVQQYLERSNAAEKCVSDSGQ